MSLFVFIVIRTNWESYVVGSAANDDESRQMETRLEQVPNGWHYVTPFGEDDHIIRDVDHRDDAQTTSSQQDKAKLSIQLSGRMNNFSIAI